MRNIAEDDGHRGQHIGCRDLCQVLMEELHPKAGLEITYEKMFFLLNTHNSEENPLQLPCSSPFSIASANTLLNSYTS